MSAFREAAIRSLESSLACPVCGAMNRPGATYIEVSFDFKTAVCIVCARSGPIARYQPPEPPR